MTSFYGSLQSDDRHTNDHHYGHVHALSASHGSNCILYQNILDSDGILASRYLIIGPISLSQARYLYTEGNNR